MGADDLEGLTARFMRRRLTKSNIVKEAFDHRLSTLEAAIRPTQFKKHALKTAHGNINTSKAAELVLTELEVEQIIMEGPRKNLNIFLLAVDQLQNNVEFLTFSWSSKSSDNALSHARGLLCEAMSKIEEEFKHLLIKHSKSVDPGQLILPLSSVAQCQPENPSAIGASLSTAAGKDVDSWKAPAEAGEPPFSPMSIPSNIIPQLHEMAHILIVAGHHRQCIEAYRDVRSAILEQSLSKLGVEKLSKEDVQKMPWEALEGKIGNWMQYMRIAVNVLFAMERMVCGKIFYHLDPHRERCFAEVTESSSNILLSFGEAIATSKKSPEMLFVLLDMYETMQDLTSKVETIFAGRAGAGMRKLAVVLTLRIAHLAHEIFGYFVVAVEKDATKTLVQDGAIHPLTSYVVKYVNFLFDYQATLEQLILEQPKDGKTAFHLGGATMRIMQVLHTNLVGKAKMYKDPQLFLRNNVRYMVKSVRRPKARDPLGDNWAQLHRGTVQQQANAYKRAGKVVQQLSGQGLSYSLSGGLSSGTCGGDSGRTRAQALSYVMAALLMTMFFSIVSGSISSTGISNEVNALITMKLDLSDPGNALESWDKHAIDPCGFIHITCSNQLSVVRIDLSSAKLTGTLSPAVGSLPNLQHIVMSNNILFGTLPLELGALSNLVTLDLANNKFNGTIPSTIEQLQSLVYLRLNRNSFSGTFPAFLANMTRLQYLDLSFNDLSPPVPDISAPNFNITGNPLLCGSGPARGCPPPIQFQPITNDSFAGLSHATSHKPNGWFLACGFLSAAVVVVAITLGLYSWRRRRNKPVFFDVHAQGPDAPLGQLKKFTLKELQAATDNFDGKNVLGKGGFGHVYKGSLPDGSLIAVKRLKDATIAGGELQFQMEVEMISMAVHRNLLRLWGFCMTPTERLLVYPFMMNGSVASRLHDTILGKPALDWPMRKRIAIGAARGLLYLHEHCDPKIIHRDVKAANILLDEGFEAVVGDFGLAKLLDHEDTHITTAVRGTVGHIAPEYLSTGQSSEKTDVFGYGVLLLELITGERAFDFGRLKQHKDVMLLDWVKSLHHEKKLECLADPRLKTDFNAFELEEMVQVALLCTQSSPLDRPTMAMVVRMLEGDGLAERWEEWQKVEVRRTEEARLLPRRYDRLLEDSCFDLEAVELSGPR